MSNRRTWLFLILVLMLLLATPAQAHGEEVEEQAGPAGPWLVGLIYLQLLIVPFVGVWLAMELWAAWRPCIMTDQVRRHRNDDKREQG
ncbi:MAG: hypothetical protein R3300_12420 [Candidatus Promineifilaceae bacterium]|nr:hypothetical protein [Candidatus Promineifilaceae bacterium]